MTEIYPLPNPPHKGEGEPALVPHKGKGEPALVPHKGEGEPMSALREGELVKACPFCKAGEVDVISLFGSQVMTMQCRCRKCGNYFEASKY